LIAQQDYFQIYIQRNFRSLSKIVPSKYALSNVGTLQHALSNVAIIIKTILNTTLFLQCKTSLHDRGIRVDPTRDIIEPCFRRRKEGIASHFIDTSLNFISLRLFRCASFSPRRHRKSSDHTQVGKKRGSDGKTGGEGWNRGRQNEGRGRLKSS